MFSDVSVLLFTTGGGGGSSCTCLVWAVPVHVLSGGGGGRVHPVPRVGLV